MISYIHNLWKWAANSLAQRKAQKLARTESMFQYGKSFYYGEGKVKDYKKALKWFKKAAKQGHAQAQYYLGE